MLPEADVGRERVAQALRARGAVRIAALADEHVDRLGRAAVADLPVRPGVRLAQVAEVAQPRTALVLGVVRERPGELGDLVLVEEDSYGSGQAFPHAYGPIPVAAVVGTVLVG